MKKFFVILIVCAGVSHAQILDTVWQKIVQANLYYAYPRYEGGFVFTGVTDDADWHCLLMATDQNGTILWRNIGSDSTSLKDTVLNFKGIQVRQLPDSSYIVVGRRIERDYDEDVIFAKYSKFGRLSWTKTYDYGSKDPALSFIVTSDKGYLVTAVGRIIKFDQNCNQQWTYPWKTTITTVDHPAQELPDGSFALITEDSVVYANRYLIFLDHNGNFTRKVSLNMFRFMAGPVGVFYHSNKVIVTAPLTNDNNIWTYGIEHFSMTGDSLSFNSCIAEGETIFQDSTLGIDGFVLVSWTTYGAYANTTFLTKMNVDGKVLWEKHFPLYAGFGTDPNASAVNNKGYICVHGGNQNTAVTYLEFNFPPRIVTDPSGLNKSIFEDSLYTQTISAVDSFPSEKLTFSLIGTSLPGATIDPDKGVITWLPSTNAYAGLHRASVMVRDRLNQSDTISWNLTVIPVNDPPTIQSILPTAVKEGDSVRFAAKIVDEENGPFTYTWKMNGQVRCTDSIFPCYFDYLSKGFDTLSLEVLDGTNRADFVAIINVANRSIAPQLLLPDSGSIDNTTMIHYEFVSNKIDPDLDMHSLNYRIRIIQNNPSARDTIFSDTLSSDSTAFGSIKDIAILQPGPIAIAVEAFDRKGYTTGFGKAISLMYSNFLDINTACHNYPAHFSAICTGTVLRLSVPDKNEQAVAFSLSIFDLRGKKIAAISMSPLLPGYHSIKINKEPLPCGKYFLVIRSKEFNKVISLFLPNEVH